MKIINIKNPESTLAELVRLQKKQYFYHEIMIDNLHLKKINEKVGMTIFDKNSLFVSPRTLWAVMQSGYKDNSHHFHDLSPNDVYKALLGIFSLKAIYQSLIYPNRYILVTDYIINQKYPIVIIIENHAPLINNSLANVNKLVTIYPKDKVSTQNNKLLYRR